MPAVAVVGVEISLIWFKTLDRKPVRITLLCSLAFLYTEAAH